MTIHVVVRGSDPWFVAKDVCINPRDVVAALAEDEVDTDILGGEIISEAGLYRLLEQKRLNPAASARWEFLGPVSLPKDCAVPLLQKLIMIRLSLEE